MSMDKKHAGMVRVGRKYEPEEVLSVIRDRDLTVHKKVRRDFGGYSIKMGYHRYWTFSEKGCTSRQVNYTMKFD